MFGKCLKKLQCWALEVLEPRPERVGEVAMSDKNVYETAIKVPGEYRLYVYVLDNTGFVSTANIPFQVID